MLWLKTFGGAVLYDDEHQPIGGAATHRRTVGLLAVLAAAGEGGLTRDKLVGIFWPDFEQRRARHSLTQALYAARRATGHDDLFDAGEDVRLNFAHIGCDVREFQERLNRGDDEGASTLYQGPFLDGFFLQSSEFDLWQAQQRAHFEDRFMGAANRVIVRSENEGDFPKAIQMARRIVSYRATDAAAVINLMRLLAQAGNRAAAIDQAELYAAIMREQYEIEPHPSVIGYAEELKETPVPLVINERSGPEPTLRHPDVPGPATGASAETGTRRSWRRRTAVFWVMAGVMAIAIAIAAVQSRSRRTEVPWSGVESRTLIAPFRVRGTDPALHYLGDGMIELLALRLADDSVDRALDPASIIRAWRSADVEAGAEVPITKLIAVARRLGAERVLTGSVVGNPRHVVISAAVVDVSSQQITARASVEGSVDTLTALIDDLARKLLLADVAPQDRLTQRLTVSLPALRAHVRGTAAYAQGDYALAQRFYNRALELDSTFALAAFNLALAASRMADFEAERSALDHAWRHQVNLTDKDKAHLSAALGPSYPRASSLSHVVAAWRRAARLAPERAEVWAGLAGSLHERMTAARTAIDREAMIAALEHALQLDAGHVGANVLLAHVRPAQPIQQQAGRASLAADVRAPFVSWWRSFALPGAAADAVTDSLEKLGPANLRAIALAGHYVKNGMRHSEKAVQLLLAKAVDANDAMSLLTAQHSIARNQGKEDAAQEATRRMQRTRPAGRAHLRLRVLDALYDSGDSTAADAALRHLETTAEVGGGAADICVRAQWEIARGDLEHALVTLEVLRAQEAQTPVIASVQPLMCVPLIEAALAVARRSEQAAAQVQALDSLSFTNTGAGDLAAYANIAVAQMHQRLNAPEQALAAIRRRPFATTIWPRYHAASMRIEQQLCASADLGSLCPDAASTQ